ncbi:TPA: transposase [Acinetobacter baumannii]|uniref:Transposase n=11 Tax=Acinetobacter baumannii TaxID=470 RepID=A0AAD2U676_ACIBA|nr:transposase [Acinetobacter baumannii]EHU3048313.1 transposase [Acinetobacter baumannii]EIB7171513.1 transposase [Acinetobacter baumannii]EKU3570339.1 transposase [Acinetobacter baumannii]EKW9459645.1 transposase [Acinetobacter baumannii]EKY1704527.1 transposase [Acinetobacter baumannii]
MPQKFRYNGLKTRRKAIVARRKAHTFKVKAIIHYKTQKILSLCTSRGAVHDFELFKRNLNQIHVGVFILADKGYQRIYTVYPNSLLPLKAKKQKSKKAKKQKSKKAKKQKSKKAKKHCKLYPELKIYNQEINKRRIGIEHVFGSLKTFKILAERYRNRGKRLSLRFNLIAGIYNLELTKK